MTQSGFIALFPKSIPEALSCEGPARRGFDERLFSELAFVQDDRSSCRMGISMLWPEDKAGLMGTKDWPAADSVDTELDEPRFLFKLNRAEIADRRHCPR